MKKSTKAVQRNKIEVQFDEAEHKSETKYSQNKKPVPKKPFGGSTPGMKMYLSTRPRIDTR